MFADRKFASLLILPAACFTILIITTAVNAQGPYKPGDKVEYKAEKYPVEKWKAGTVEYMTPSGQQVIVREEPNEFYPKGNTRAYAYSNKINTNLTTEPDLESIIYMHMELVQIDYF